MKTFNEYTMNMRPSADSIKDLMPPKPRDNALVVKMWKDLAKTASDREGMKIPIEKWVKLLDQQEYETLYFSLKHGTDRTVDDILKRARAATKRSQAL